MYVQKINTVCNKGLNKSITSIIKRTAVKPNSKQKQTAIFES